MSNVSRNANFGNRSIEQKCGRSCLRCWRNRVKHTTALKPVDGYYIENGDDDDMFPSLFPSLEKWKKKRIKSTRKFILSDPRWKKARNDDKIEQLEEWLNTQHSLPSDEDIHKFLTSLRVR